MIDSAIPDAFLRWGHLQANLDPLGRLLPQAHPELDITGEAAQRGRDVYCGSIGVEFMHIPEPERRLWIRERMESPAPVIDRRKVLSRLIAADAFERVLQTRYLGTKRFSLEGAIALIPLLDEVLETAAERQASQVVIGMSHRGRLNVMVHTVGKRTSDVMAGFEDVDPRSVLGAGDVKYHVGATGEYAAKSGARLRISLVSNPSHLEKVNPVAAGRARAKQDRLAGGGRTQVLPICLHGDAAFAGQGIVAETLNFAGLRGYDVGGTIHVVVNNLVGFTTTPRDLYSTRYATDLAKRLPIPIFHVNGEDPEAVVRAARMAAEYRFVFCTDVVLDLIGYRRHGHSEVEDPTTTQPALYRKIERLPPLWQSYAKTVNVDAGPMEQDIRKQLEEEQERAKTLEQKPSMRQLPEYWSPYRGGRYDASLEVDTALDPARLAELAGKIAAVPDGFHVHTKLKRMLEQRAEMAGGKRAIDWGTAETLAFGSLLWDGMPVRLSGEDVRRGTFNQRNVVLVDIQSGDEIVPLENLHPQQARFECYDSPLSEAAVLGFEFGFSRDYPEALVMWEAQYGDFVNEAQVIVDQFISASEDKWGLLSGLVMLLPHGFEGQGPEHSSARFERFLQLAAEDNLQVCQPTTAAQYFHMLRRQALRKWRKPLIVMTPKGMLRDPRTACAAGDLTSGRFETVLADRELSAAKTMLICTGKIAHELRSERKTRRMKSTAIVALEQLYPFPAAELKAELDRLGCEAMVWVQEEPANMGALSFVQPRLEALSEGRFVRTVKRSASASPATGSRKAHDIEQSTLMALAFGGNSA